MKIRGVKENQNHQRKSNSHVSKEKSTPEPRGILYNYISPKRFPLATKKKKPVLKDKPKTNSSECDNLKDNAYKEINRSNYEQPAFDQSTADPYNLHKMVWVDGKCLIVKHKQQPMENKEDNECVNSQDSGTENNAKHKKSSNKHNYDDSHVDNVAPPATIIVNRSGNKQEQGYYRLTPSKNYIQKLSYCNDNVTQGLINVNSVDLYDNKMYATKEDLADARQGKAMILIPISKYKSLNNTLTMMHSKEGRKHLEEKVKTRPIPKHTKSIQTEQCDDLNENMKTLETRLSEIFTESQVSMIKNPNRTRSIQWSEEEMASVVHLWQMISQPAYIYLKYKMNFPMPSLPVVRRWMKNKDIPLLPKQPLPKDPLPTQFRAAKMYCSTHTQTENGEEMDQTQDIDQLEPQNSDNNEVANDEDDDDEINTTYLEVDNLNDNDLTYVQDDSNESCDESGPAQLKYQRNYSSMLHKCLLCMHPFDTEAEVRKHVSLHYKDSTCISYLDAEKPYTCEFCDATLGIRSHLVHHHRLHLGINTLRCWYTGCKFIGWNKDSLSQHVQSHSATLQHYRRNTLTMECTYPGCTETFSSKASLKKHNQIYHSLDSPPFKCHLCPLAAFDHKSYLESHLQNHETRQINKCGSCLKVFYDYGEYYTHCVEMDHFLKLFKCAGCGDRFDFKYKLRQHKLKCTSKPDDSDNENNYKRKELKRKLDNEKSSSLESADDAKRRKIYNEEDSSNENAAAVAVKRTKSIETLNRDVPKQNTMSEVSNDGSAINKEYPDPDLDQSLDSHQQIQKNNSKSTRQNILVSQARQQENSPRALNKNQSSPLNKVIAVSGSQTHNVILGHVHQQLKSTSTNKIPKINEKRILVPAKRQEKVITLQENQQKRVDEVNQRQVAITVTAKSEQKAIKVQNKQQKVFTLTEKEHHPIYVIPATNQQKVHQQKVFKQPSKTPDKVRTVPGIHTNNVFVIQGNDQQKVITMSENVSPKVVTMQANKQLQTKQNQKRISTSVTTVTDNRIKHVISNPGPQIAQNITLRDSSSKHKTPIHIDVIRTVNTKTINIPHKETKLKNVISLSQPVTQTTKPNEIIKSGAFGNTIQEQLASLLGGTYPNNIVILQTDNENHNITVPSYETQEGVDTIQEEVDSIQGVDTSQEGVDTIQEEVDSIQRVDTIHGVDTIQEGVDTIQPEPDTIQEGKDTIHEEYVNEEEGYAILEGQDIVSYQQREDSIQAESSTKEAEYIIHEVEGAIQETDPKEQQYISNEEGRIQVRNSFNGEYILHEVADTIQEGDSFKEEQYILLDGSTIQEGESFKEGESVKEGEYVIHTLEGDDAHVFQGEEEIETELEQFEVTMEDDTSGLFD